MEGENIEVGKPFVEIDIDAKGPAVVSASPVTQTAAKVEAVVAKVETVVVK